MTAPIEALKQLLNKVSGARQAFGFEGTDSALQMSVDAENALIRAAETLVAELEASRQEVERAFGMLDAFGIPRDRARTVANGIMVFDTRMQREVRALREQVRVLEQRVPRWIRSDEPRPPALPSIRLHTTDEGGLKDEV